MEPTTASSPSTSYTLYPQWQQIAITIAPAITGTLSLVGCWLILYLILTDWKKKKSKKVQYRLLLGRTISDTISSITWIVWSLPIPKNTPNVWGAIGNISTCQLQGFLIQCTISSAIYNGALSHFFYYSIVHGMSDKTYIRSKRWEISWHLLAILYSIGSGLAGIALNSYHPGSFGCWYFPSPIQCWFGPRSPLNEETCSSGQNAYMYGWLFMGIPILIIFGFVTYFMLKIHYKVKSVMNRAALSHRTRSDNMLMVTTTTKTTPTMVSAAAKEVAGQQSSPSMTQLQSQQQTQEEIIPGDQNDEVDEGKSQEPKQYRSLYEEIAAAMDGEQPPFEKTSTAKSSKQQKVHQRQNTFTSIRSVDSDDDDFLLHMTADTTERGNIARASSSIRQRNVVDEQLQCLTYRRIQERKRESAIQAYCYIGVYLLTRCFSFVVYIIDMIPGIQQPFGTLFLEQTLKPLVGFLNFLVYIRPRVVALRRTYPDGFTYIQAIHAAIFNYEDFMATNSAYRPSSVGTDAQLSRASRVVLEQSSEHEQKSSKSNMKKTSSKSSSSNVDAAVQSPIMEQDDDDKQSDEDGSPSSSTKESSLVDA